MDTLNVLKVDSRNSVNHKVSAIPRPIFSKSPIKDRRPFEKNFLCPIPEKSKPDSRNQGSRTENPEELNEVIQNLEKPTVVNVELPRNQILIGTKSQEIQGPEKSDLRNVQHNRIQKNKNIQWLDQLFPDQDKKINPEDIHEGNLTREQSEERLIWLLMTFAFITTIVLIYQIISLVGKLTGPAKVAIDYEPPTLNIFGKTNQIKILY